MAFQQLHRATSLEDAHKTLLSQPGNFVLGGGLWIKKSDLSGNTAIDLSRLDLDRITDEGDRIRVGAMVSLRDFETNPLVASVGNGFLTHAVGQIMGVALRKLATIGGSIAAKLPFSDVLTPLLTLDVTLVFYPLKEMSLESYLSSKGKTNDILTHVMIRKQNIHGAFKKVGNTPLDFALLNVAVSHGEGHFAVAVGSRPGASALAAKTMAFLNAQKKVGAKEIEKASEMAVEELSFASTTFASSDYRKTLAQTYVRRCLEEVLNHVN